MANQADLADLCVERMTNEALDSVQNRVRESMTCFIAWITEDGVTSGVYSGTAQERVTQLTAAGFDFEADQPFYGGILVGQSGERTPFGSNTALQLLVQQYMDEGVLVGPSA